MGGGRPQRQTMAEMVAGLQAVEPTPQPWKDRFSEAVLAPDGRWFGLQERSVDAEESARLRAGGALVALDVCGCGGGCGVEWLSQARLRRLSGKPTIGRAGKGRWGQVSRWLAEDGTHLLLASNYVRWGDELA